MLNLSTDLHTKTMSSSFAKITGATSQDMAKSGWTRGSTLRQLGVNYRWSEIVLDERRPAGEEATVWKPYGEEGDAVQAGDRAPDAPGLIPLPSTAPAKTLFDLLNPTRHTAFIFPPASGLDSSTTAAIDALTHIASTVGSPTLETFIITSTESFVPPPAISAFFDSERHARLAYGVDGSAVVVAIVRPDGVLGGWVGGAEGVKAYFAKILMI